MIDLLNKEDNFLKVIALFLESRIKLGCGDCVYALDIRHVDDGRITAGYSLDYKVYKVEDYQIWKRINTEA